MNPLPRVDQLRQFNRFWTARIGVLDEGLLQTPYTLTEGRVLFELGARSSVEVGELKALLRIDAGYLSRILAKLRRARLVAVAPVPGDRRKQVVTLTPAGRRVFRDLDARSNAEIQTLLASQSEDDQRRLIDAMATITRTFSTAPARAYQLREPQPGDLGWVVERHGAIYAAEYDLNREFEALVAKIVAEFAAQPRARAWIAELAGARVGCVFCVEKSPRVAQLRLLLVEASARGLGVGAALVATCVAHARHAGYKKLVLWTNDILVSARKLYEAAGFELTSSGTHHSFGQDLVEQTWELVL